MSSSIFLLFIHHFIVIIICHVFLTLSPGLRSVVLNKRNTDISVTQDQQYTLYKTKFTRFQTEYGTVEKIQQPYFHSDLRSVLTRCSSVWEETQSKSSSKEEVQKKVQVNQN